MYMPNSFRLPTSLPQPLAGGYQKPTFSGGVARPTPFPRPLVGPPLPASCPTSAVPGGSTPGPFQPPAAAIPASTAGSPASSLPSITTLPGFSAARMAIENRGPATCSLARPLPVSTTAAAVAAAQWIHHSHAAEAQAQVQAQVQAQAQAAVALSFQSQLQHFLANEKALAASPFLDPFSKAGPFFDLARMGHYPFGKKLFGCPQCRYMTDRKNNLKRHISTMHQECDRALECCGVLFKNKASLRDHVLIFHSNGYMCRFCGRNFCRKALLKRHLTVHSGQKDYICSQCDYATSHKSNLERHKKVHERNSSDGSDTESTSTDRSTGRSSGSGSDQDLKQDHPQGKTTCNGSYISISKDDDDDDALNLSDIDVDADDDALIDVDGIDIVSSLQDEHISQSRNQINPSADPLQKSRPQQQGDLANSSCLSTTPSNLSMASTVRFGNSVITSMPKTLVRSAPVILPQSQWTPEV